MKPADHSGPGELDNRNGYVLGSPALRCSIHSFTRELCPGRLCGHPTRRCACSHTGPPPCLPGARGGGTCTCPAHSPEWPEDTGRGRHMRKCPAERSHGGMLPGVLSEASRLGGPTAEHS